MAAPTNTTVGTALAITTLPYSGTFSIADLTDDQTVWFSYLAPSGQAAVGCFGWRTGSTYLPEVTVYYGTPSALTQIITTENTRPFSIPLIAGRTYYIKIRNKSTTDAAASLTFSVVAPPAETMPAGSLLVNDDTEGFPLTVLDATDGHVGRIVNPFPHGEMGDCLPNGRALFKSDDRSKLSLFGADLSLLTEVSGVISDVTVEGDRYLGGTNAWTPQIRACGAHTFYVLDVNGYDATVTLHTVSDEGVPGAKVWTLPGHQAQGGMGVSPDGTILYQCQGGGRVVSRYDLVGEGALSALYTDPSYPVGERDLLVLNDGSVLIPVNKPGTNYGGYIKHVAADGSVLHTYEMDGVVTGGVLYLNRIAKDVTDDTFWVWRYGMTAGGVHTGECHFDKVQVSDGAVLAAIVTQEFNQGVGPLATNANPAQRFGPSNSCPLFVLRAEQPADDDGGDDIPLPTCEGVQATIVDPPDVNIISGTGTGLNATQWRVVRLEDGVVMAFGGGAEAVFSFEGDYFVTYQLQFGNGTVWSSSGCTFRFTFPLPIDTMADTTSPCIDYTVDIVNMALTRIGANKFITAADLANPVTNEAKVAALHISGDIDRTLRDFPWQFATGYCVWTAPLAGTELEPVNADWQYSYRCPADFIFARRVCGQNDERRRFDPNPYAFRLNLDDTWFLIYCNQPASEEVPLVLEYTRRPGCPASTPDALFRSCLAWRVAASLAPSLGRDEKVTAYCEQMYRYELPQAEAKSAAEQQQEKDGDAGWIRER